MITKEGTNPIRSATKAPVVEQQKSVSKSQNIGVAVKAKSSDRTR